MFPKLPNTYRVKFIAQRMHLGVQPSMSSNMLNLLVLDRLKLETFRKPKARWVKTLQVGRLGSTALSQSCFSLHAGVVYPTRMSRYQSRQFAVRRERCEPAMIQLQQSRRRSLYCRLFRGLAILEEQKPWPIRMHTGNGPRSTSFPVESLTSGRKQCAPSIPARVARFAGCQKRGERYGRICRSRLH